MLDSPVFADGKIYFQDKFGTGVLIAAGTESHELGRNTSVTATARLPRTPFRTGRCSSIRKLTCRAFKPDRKSSKPTASHQNHRN
jgi:hypothetical protein